MKIYTYLVAFCFIDCGVIASGITYNGKDEKSSISYNVNIFREGKIR